MFYHQCADIAILVSVKIHMLLLLVACNAYAPAIFFPAALVASTCVPSNQPPDHHLSFFLGHLSFPAQTRHCSFCLVFLVCQWSSCPVHSFLSSSRAFFHSWEPVFPSQVMALMTPNQISWTGLLHQVRPSPGVPMKLPEMLPKPSIDCTDALPL